MLNHIVIMGRLTRDPELRRTGSGLAVTSFSVAVERDFGGRDGGERKTDFFDCVAWDKRAEFVSKYFTKGSMIVVSGRHEFRDWNDKDGNKRRSAEVIAENIHFGGGKREDQGGNAYGGNSYGGNRYGNNSYGGGNQGGYNGGNSYGQQPTGGFGGYAQPASAPASDFAMLEDDDAQLPF